MSQPQILALAGPTASGKTDVALALAERFELSLISLDSAMVYRGMDIGTAKPTAEVLARHPHELVDIRDPAEGYSAAEFLADADDAVQKALARGRTPLLVGGTMLYLKTFREGLAPMPSADPAVRAELEAEAARVGAVAFHARLAEVDPVAASKMHPNNLTRVQRALEVFELSGRPISSFWSEGLGVIDRLGATLLEFAIEPDDRAELHRRISARLEAMFEEGFIDEVRALRARGDLDPDMPAMRAVGYRQVWDFLEQRDLDQKDLDQRDLDQDGGSIDGLRVKVQAATRQLARRQLTWLRGWPDMRRLGSAEPAACAAEIARLAGLGG